MADFKLLGSPDPVTSSLGDMTQGIGYPLVPVEGTPVVVNRSAFLPVMFSKGATLRAGRYLRIGEVDTQDTPYTVHTDAEIVAVIISRSDEGSGTIELVLDDVVSGSYPTETKRKIHRTNIAAAQGSTVALRSAETSRMMRNVIVAVIFKITQE